MITVIYLEYTVESLTLWSSGKALASQSEGYGFDSHCGNAFFTEIISLHSLAEIFTEENTECSARATSERSITEWPRD